MKIQYFKKNTAGRDFVVGDIHGCFSKLRRELDEINFNPDKDRLFSVGDLVDRGKESHLALEWISKPWFHSVLANHEQMAIDASDGYCDSMNYISNGGNWFLKLERNEQIRTAAHFRDLPVCIEVETANGIVGIFHADCMNSREDNHFALNDKTRDWNLHFLWSRQRAGAKGNNQFVAGYDKVFLGHTPMAYTIKGNVHFIDNGAWLPNKYHKFNIIQFS